MMQQWPYGANILIECTSTNISENIGTGEADFITSRVKDTIMTFKYTEINGKLVSISTNLKEISRTRNPDTRTGLFTLRTINNGKTSDGEKPYINLCCNDVKIPLAFINHDESEPGTENKWGKSTINADTITLYGHDAQEAPYIKFAKEIVVNWNSTSTEQIMKGMNKTGLYRQSYLACDVYYLYLDKNKNIQSGKTNIWNTGDDNLTESSTWKVTIPRLDGEKETSLVWDKNGIKNNISKSNKFYYKFFMLGVQVKMWDGYTTDKFETLYFIGKDKNSINKTYDNTTFSEPITGIYYLESTDGFPNLTVTNLKNKWNSDFFFTTQEKNGKKYYISPSTSEIFTQYNIKSHCDYCDDCEDCESDIQCGCNTQCSTYYDSCNWKVYFSCEGYFTCGQDGSDGDIYCVTYYGLWQTRGDDAPPLILDSCDSFDETICNTYQYCNLYDDVDYCKPYKVCQKYNVIEEKCIKKYDNCPSYIYCSGDCDNCDNCDPYCSHGDSCPNYGGGSSYDSVDIYGYVAPNTNVRSGPGSTYSVIDGTPGYAGYFDYRVHFYEKKGQWYHIDSNQKLKSGWVNSSQINFNLG